MWILLILLIIIMLGVIFWLSSLLIAQIIGSPTVYAYNSAIIDSFKLARLKKDELVIDLGCGDGRSLILAAKKFGARGIGVERSLYCYLRANLKVLMAGERSRVKVILGDFKKLEPDLKNADVVYLYLLNSTLAEIEEWFFTSIGGQTRVVSLAFWFPNRQPIGEIETYNLRKTAKARLYRK